MPRTRAHVQVSGHVQGVNFRYYTRRQAETEGVTGWVRNNADGTVEAVFEGEEAKVHRLVDWCRRGPSRARVENVDVSWEPWTGEFDRFEVRSGGFW